MNMISKALIQINIILFSCGCILAEKIVLIEDPNISLSLTVAPTASVADADWLLFELKNRSNKRLSLHKLNYSINAFEESQGLANNKIVDGKFGKGTKYDLIHWFHDQVDLAKADLEFFLEAGTTLKFWKHPSNKAAISIESSLIRDEELCALMYVELSYSSNRMDKTLLNAEEVICTDWIKLNHIKRSDLMDRFESCLKDAHFNSVHGSILSLLTQLKELMEMADPDLIIDGLTARQDHIRNTERILLLLVLETKGEFDNPKLIKHYKNCLSEKNCQWTADLEVYWNNALLDDLLESKLFVNSKAILLELHSKHWRNNDHIKQKIYSFLSSEYALDLKAVITKDNFKNWYNKIKYLAISRESTMIEPLSELLNDERFFPVEDWSGLGASKVIRNQDASKKKIVKLRVCDVAYVSLLRILDQVSIKNELINNQLKPTLFIDNKWRGVNKELDQNVSLVNPYTVLKPNLKLAEKYYYLYDENKTALLELLKSHAK